MAKKSWISVKIGMIDPKHQKAIGPAVWLFLHILDNADWETGTVEGYTDKQAHDELGIPKDTIIKHRRKLQAAGYITCKKNDYDQTITIHNWTDPRKYSGKIINPLNVGSDHERSVSQSDHERSGGSDQQSDQQTDHQSDQRSDHERSVPLIESSNTKDQLSEVKETPADSFEDSWVEETSHKTAAKIRHAMGNGREVDWSHAPERILSILDAFTLVWCDIYDRMVLDGDRRKFIKQAEQLRDGFTEDVAGLILEAGKRQKAKNLSISGPLSLKNEIWEIIEESKEPDYRANDPDFWDKSSEEVEA